MIYRKIEHKLVNTAVRSSLQVIVKSIVVKNANAKQEQGLGLS